MTANQGEERSSRCQTWHGRMAWAKRGGEIPALQSAQPDVTSPMSDLHKITVSLADIERLREMRTLQRRFFRDKDKTVVGRAKYLEQQVDRWLEGLPSPENDGLFSEGKP